MAAPVVSMQQLIEAGAHFGHQTHRWNPRMKPYIFGQRNGIHILDLSQTVPLFARALEFVAASVESGGKVLFVGTKRQAQQPIADAARASGQHFVNHRWLGGMLTNWKTISNSIRQLKTLEETLAGDTSLLTKKEILQMTRLRDKLEMSLGGIRDMGGIPDVMFVIDANKEELAIKEANVLGIPVVAILDSNVNPNNIAFPVPANDDAARAIRMYCDAVAQAASKGGLKAVADSGVDMGAMAEPPKEEASAAPAPAPAPTPAPAAEPANAAAKAAASAKMPQMTESATAHEAAPAKEEVSVKEAEAKTEEAPAEEAKEEKKPAAKKAAAKKPAAKKADDAKSDDAKSEDKVEEKRPAAKKAPAKKAAAKKAPAKKADDKDAK